MRLAVACLITAIANSQNVCATTSAGITVDFSDLDDRTFDGVGALSGGGGVTRLLIDYPEDVKSDIFDALFTPMAGASPHIIKVEIGGDSQSTEGTEPSHMHSKDDLDCYRGYEWTVLTEAKKRNPDILTYGLTWAVPGWIGNGSFFSQDNINYHLSWLNCAKHAHSVDIDFMGIWNERAWDADWIIDLRSALDSNGFKDTKIVAADDSDWSIGSAMATNSTLKAAVNGAVGVHYPYPSKRWPPADVLSLGTPLWASEEWDLSRVADFGGAAVLARTLNTNYISGSMTATIVWNLVFSWYAPLPFSQVEPGSVSGAGHSLLYAAEPWSGHWSWQPAAAALAHTSQFSKPGWSYVKPSSNHDTSAGSGFFADGDGSFVTLVSPPQAHHMHDETTSVQATSGSDFSIVMERGTTGPLDVTMTLKNPAGGIAPTVLHAYLTNDTVSLLQLPDVSVVGDVASFTLPASSFLTLTTTKWGQGPPRPKVLPIPQPARFPRSYNDSFDGYAATRTYPKYTCDEGGFFTINDHPAPSQAGPAHTSDVSTPGAFVLAPRETGDVVLTQVITQRPIAWEKNPDPATYLGDFNAPNGTNTGWSGYTIAARAAIESVPLVASDSAYLRLCTNLATYVRKGAPPQGQCLIVTADLTTGGDATWSFVDAGKEFATGSVGAPVKIGEWQDISFTTVDGIATASLNGTVLTKSATFTGSQYGMAALGSGWHRAAFDDLFVKPTATTIHD